MANNVVVPFDTAHILVTTDHRMREPAAAAQAVQVLGVRDLHDAVAVVVLPVLLPHAQKHGHGNGARPRCLHQVDQVLPTRAREGLYDFGTVTTGTSSEDEMTASAMSPI